MSASMWKSIGGVLCWAVLAWALLQQSARASEPRLQSTTPWGGQRGTELDLMIQGERLGDAQEVFWYQPGITTKTLAADGKNPGQVKLRVAIAGNAQLGPHDFRVRTATGISNLLTFSVGALPEVQEIEPNNDPPHAQKIALDTTVNGTLQYEDVDCYQVEAHRGERITAEIEGMRLGRELYDPHLEILDAHGTVLARADSTPAAWYDALCSIVAPADGSYVILLRETTYGGSGGARYRLHVGRFPRPLAAVPGGGAPGETVEVRWLGLASGPATQKIALPAQPTLDFGLCAQDATGVTPWPLPFRLTKLPNVIEVEPNDDAAHATPFTAPAALNGVLDKPGDVDRFRFAAKKGQVFDVRVFARALRSPVDSVLTIERAKGGVMASNDDSNSPDSFLRFSCPADDEYVIAVTDQLKAGGPEYAYRVEVAQVQPQLTITLPEREQFLDIVAAVPKGNRVALLANVQREEFGGKVDLEFRGLPPGVSMQSVTVDETRGSVPILLSATEQAATAGALVDVVGSCRRDQLAIEGHLRQRSSLLRGQNNREIWNRNADRLALAVVEPVPYRIELVQPKAPLVQSGSLELRAVATCKPGFDRPINLTLLSLPPGVSSVNSVTIPPGQGEAHIPLTADGGAAVGAWPMVVLAAADTDLGPRVVSSGLVTLEVKPPLFRLRTTPLAILQGRAADMKLGIDKNQDFPGPVKAELVGLPYEVTSKPLEFNSSAGEIVFPIQTTVNSPAGRHRGVMCRAVVMVAGEPVTQLMGTGELKIQKPWKKK